MLRLADRAQPPQGPPSLDPLEDAPLEAAAYASLAVGGRADLAVFAATGSPPVVRPGSCIATVPAGRPAFRKA